MARPTTEDDLTPAAFASRYADSLAVPPGFDARPRDSLYADREIQQLAAYELTEGATDLVGLEHHPYRDEYPFWVTWWHVDSERAATGAATIEAAVAAFEAMMETVRAAVTEYDDRLGGRLAEQ